MRTLHWIPIGIATLTAFAAPHAVAQTSRPSSQPAWRNLFDGKTLQGWSKAGGKATYAAEDGAIVGTTMPHTPNTFLRTNQEFGDFELELEFFVDPQLNSGVQFRSKPHPKGTIFGYQCEIDPSKRAWTCGIYDERRRGWLAPLKDNEAAQKAFRQGEWNAMRITCQGAHLRTWINGIPAADHLDSMTPNGVIALQVHGVGKRKDPLQVKWRNVRVRERGEHAWTTGPSFAPANGGYSISFPKDAAAVRWSYGSTHATTLDGPFGTMKLPETNETKKSHGVSVSRSGNRYAVHVDGKLKLDTEAKDDAPPHLILRVEASAPIELTEPEQLAPVK